ncbi:MAG: flagellar type III secretion system protein FliR [Firmicutes bacterium]|nr:flagellar type III secretion system protein FliR [Bacillota bacterium]
MPDTAQLPFFFLILARITAFFISGPLFSLQGIPATVKVGLSFLVAVIVFPLVASDTGPQQVEGWYYLLALARETMVGLVIGYTASLFIAALVYAGSLIDIHIGFFMSNMFDPVSGGMITIVSRFMYLLGLVVMLSFNGHHLIISALVKSFSLVPLNAAQATGDSAWVLVKTFAQMIGLGVQIAAPVIAVVLIIDVALGLLARTAPQINVFMLGFPIKIIAGLVTLGVMAPVLVRIIYSLCDMIESNIMILLKGLT